MPHFILPRQWRKASCIPRNVLPSQLIPWLLDMGSLTARLRQHCRSLQVRVLSQTWQRARYDEALQLNINPHEWIISRNVELICDKKVCVSAHSVFSRKILHGKGAALKKLGSRPLIEILATDPNLKRSPIEIVKILPGDRDYQRAILHTKKNSKELWCRRSIFTFFGQPVLVSETFLPEVLELKL